MSRWKTVGSARRKGYGIEIEIPKGPFAGLYAIDKRDAPLLIFEGLTAEVWARGEKCISTPWVCGSATWSDSRRMLLVRLPGSDRYGAVQVVGADLCAHYVRNDSEPTRVLVPLEFVPAKVPTLAVV